MIERTDGSPGRAGDLMLPDDAGIVGRPGDVQMQPGPLGREFFQEQPGRDRAAAVLAGVADIRIVALNEFFIFRIVRHAPEFFAGARSRARKAVVKAVVAGHHAGRHKAEHRPDRAGQRCDVHQMRAALLLRGPREGIGQDQAPLGIGVQDLDRLAGEAGDDVAGQHARV